MVRNTSGLRPQQWKPGQSGNPKGRPKKEHTLTSILTEKATLRADELADKVLELALKGDTTMLKYAYDRIEGSPTSRHESSDAFLRQRAEELAREFGKPLPAVIADLEAERARLRQAG